MLRRHPSRLSHETSCQTPSPSPQHTRPLQHRTRKAKSSCWGSNNTFKLIVGIEATALLFIWVFFSDRLLSSRLWRQHLNVRSPARGEARSAIRWDTHRRGSAVHDESLRSVVVEIPDKYKGPTLVIGGSDGSGTRAFAHFVRRLGVPMKIDDKKTLDVHGGVMFHGAGWPPLGNLILNATHSANYKLDDLSNDTRTTATKELLKFKSTVDAFQSRFYNNFPNISRATGVSVGFKAPVTMTLLPLLKDAFGPMKYLHIVRDGRDVSLSTNKSPVQKFYKSMYPDAEERLANYFNSSEPVLAMHLWNDWNTQALDWEKAHANKVDFDFLVMRSEDLLDPTKRFDSFVRLAAFVGSPMTVKELCCLSREKVVDMGQSLKSSERAAGIYGGGVTRKQWNFQSAKFIHGNAREEVKARVKAKIQSERQKRNNKEEPKEKYGRDDDDQDDVDQDDVDQDFKQELYSEYRKRITDLGNLAADVLKSRRETRRAFANTMDFNSTNRDPDLWHSTTRTATAGRVDESPTVQKRYGKWREMLKERPDLSAKLHEEGAKGLATFGYEPQTSFYDSPSPTNGFQCDETVICDEVEYEGITSRQLFHTNATKE